MGEVVTDNKQPENTPQLMTLIEHIVFTDEVPEAERAAYLDRMAAEACTSGDLKHALAASHTANSMRQRVAAREELTRNAARVNP